MVTYTFNQTSITFFDSRGNYQMLAQFLHPISQPSPKLTAYEKTKTCAS